MAATTRDTGWTWRGLMWVGGAGALLLPLLASLVSEEMSWGAEDFIAFALMLAALCGGVEIAVRVTRSGTARTLAILALIAVFLLVWAELAVGIFH